MKNKKSKVYEKMIEPMAKNRDLLNSRVEPKKEAYKIITINVPVKYLQAIEKLIVLGFTESRSSFARSAMENYFDTIIQLEQKLEALMQMKDLDDKAIVDGKVYKIIKK